MDHQFFSKNRIVFILFLLVAIACKVPSGTNDPISNQDHLNPITEIFSKLNKTLPSAPPDQAILSLREKKAVRNEVVQSAKKALSLDIADGLIDPVYDIGDPPTTAIPMYQCKGGICPCQIKAGSNKFIFVEATKRLATGREFKFNHMFLINDKQRIELPLENITVNNQNYRAFTLDVSNFKKFARGAYLEIDYGANPKGGSYVYKFMVTYDRRMVGVNNDGMQILQ